MGIDEGLRKADLGTQEVARRLGARPGGRDAICHRIAALLETAEGEEDAVVDGEPGDARLCGALLVRLGGTATATVIAAWMGWSVERTAAAVAELDRRLEKCGLRVGAEFGGRLHLRERTRLRVRASDVADELLARLDYPARRHALAHLVRGEPCPQAWDWMQPLLDLGAAVTGPYPGARPTSSIAVAFAAVRRPIAESSLLVVIPVEEPPSEEDIA